VKKLGAYEPGQYRPSGEDFKADFKEKKDFSIFLKKSKNNLFDPLTLDCNSVVNKFTVFMKGVFIFGWTEEQM